MLIQARVEKLNGDLHQPSRIRYVSRSFSVRCFICLAYWEGIDFCGYSVCCGTPQAIGSFLRNRIGDHTMDVPSCFSLGFFGIQCACIALISLFLCQVWGHDFPVVSCRSKFCLSLSIYLIFLSFSSYTRFVPSQSHIHRGFPGKIMYVRRFIESSRVCLDFLLFRED